MAELGDLSPDGWMRMYAAAMSRRFEDDARIMAAMHPGKNPSLSQTRLRKVADRLLRGAVMAEPEDEFWKDPAKMKMMLGQMGIPFKTKGKEKPKQKR